MFFCLKLQALAHDIGGCNLGAVFQMSIGVGRRGKIAVPEPFLNLFHTYTVS